MSNRHQFTLDNGLKVIVLESHRVPVVSFWIWYRVGARNELPGKTGISHWVEHMLFKGTPKYQPGSIFRTINKFGGTLNGFTWIDFTAYFETLPNTQLELAASIESDRMQNATFDPDEFERERTVILSERAGSENSPMFHLQEEVSSAAFRAHPYGQGVIGFKSDLQALTRDDLYEHYQTYYTPNNATVVVAGAVDAESARKIVERYFGTIPEGPVIPDMRRVEPPQQGIRRVTVRRPAPSPSMLLGFHAPEATHEDSAAMSVIESVLSGGKSIGIGGGGGTGRSSRLYRALVAQGLCGGAQSSFALTIDPYLFSVGASLLPDASPEEVEQVIFQEIDRLRKEPVSQTELDRAQKQVRAQFAYSRESVASQGFWHGSMSIATPDEHADAYVDRLSSVTAEDVQRVAQQWLNDDRYTVGWLHPDTAGDSSGSVDNGEAMMSWRPQFYTDGWDAHSQAQDGVPRTHLEIDETSLDSGARVISHYDQDSEVAVIDLRIPAGAITDEDQPGLARFAGQMMSRGTKNRDFAELNEELDSLGASIGVSAAREYIDVSATGLKEDVPRLLELMAEIVQFPTFPEEEFQRLKAQTLNSLRISDDDTRARAEYQLRQMLYPEGHPLYERVIGTTESIEALTTADLHAYHQRYFHPDLAIFATSGGIDPETIRGLIQRSFDTWKSVGNYPALAIPSVEPPKASETRETTLAGKSQADLAIGLPIISRKHPDYDALRMANLILGRLGLMGRLGANVRDEKGLAYYVFSNMSAGWSYGRWTSQAGIDPENIGTAIDAIMQEVERIREHEVEREELADAKSFMIGSLPLGLESSGSIAGTLLTIAYYNLGHDYVDRLPERLEAVTQERIREVAQKYLRTDQMAVSIAKPQ